VVAQGETEQSTHLCRDCYASVKAFTKRAEVLDHFDIAVLSAGVSMMAFELSAYEWD